jgi:hypothetical protein
MSSTKEAWTSQFTPGLFWRSFIEHLSSPSVCCGDRLLSISVHPRFVVEIVYWASQFTPRFVVEYWTSQFTLGLLWSIEHLSSPLGLLWSIEHLSSPLGLLWSIEHLSSPSVCCGDRLLSISVHPRFVVEIVYWASQFTLGLLWRSFFSIFSFLCSVLWTIICIFRSVSLSSI